MWPIFYNRTHPATQSRLPRPRPTFQANLASPRLISANLYSAPTCPEDDSDSVRARSSPLCGLCECVRAPPQCCARDRSVPRSNGDRLYNTVRAGVYHGACTLTVGRRRTPRDDTRTGYHHPQPTSGGLAQSAGELWLGVRQRASPPERCSPVSTVIISTTAAAHADKNSGCEGRGQYMHVSGFGARCGRSAPSAVSRSHSSGSQ